MIGSFFAIARFFLTVLWAIISPVLNISFHIDVGWGDPMTVTVYQIMLSALALDFVFSIFFRHPLGRE